MSINKDNIKAGDYIEARFYEYVETYEDGLTDWEFELLTCPDYPPLERVPATFGGNTIAISGTVTEQRGGQGLVLGAYSLNSTRLVIDVHVPAEPRMDEVAELKEQCTLASQTIAEQEVRIKELEREANDLANEARVAYVRGAKDALAIVKEECARGEERFRHRPEYLNGRSFGLWFTGGRIEELINKAEAQQ